MRFPHLKTLSVALAAGVALSACDQEVTAPESEVAPVFAKASQGRADFAPTDAIRAFVDGVNARFAATGQTIRLDYPWLFRVGPGTDPYQSLRTGSRWTTTSPEYILDVADFGGTAVPAAEVATTMASAFSTWNAVPQGSLVTTRGSDPVGNVDVLDGLYDAGGNCVFLYDVTSPNLFWHIDNGAFVFDGIAIASDIVVGGFPPETYFSQCLGSSDILAVTWTFSNVDSDGDQYRDRLYVEQYYNPAFTWTTSGSQYLDFGGPVDLETIALHEHGHAHGLGHFGGPVTDAQWKLKPNGRVFNPEAVMNPFYLGGEDRTLHPTDESGYLTMYAR